MLIRTRFVYLWFIIICWAPWKALAHPTPCNEQPWITIFVHGIISVKPFLSPYNIYILMRDDIHGSVYAHTICHARKDPFFEHYHAMQQIGLKKIDLNVIEKSRAATAFARSYDCVAHSISSHEHNTYYTYGWSALLSKKLWKDEGELFYKALLQEIETYRAQGIQPKIRIIGYSHGGTIAAHLANAYNEENTAFYVDELILLGMPGVPEAKELIQSPLFKKIYQIYSHGDRVQTLDFFSLNVVFSRKTFFGGKNLPDNFHQIGIKLYRLSSSCTAKCKYGHAWPAPPRHVRPAHPGHTELWSFGWAGGYRQYYPLYPLPIGVFIPWFIELSKQCSDCSRHISIAMHPYAEHTQIKCHDTHITYDLPGFDTSLIEQMKEDALQFCPYEYGALAYEQHLKIAIRKANEELKHQDKAV
ncbi:MAG: hypothetical protein AB7F19_01765 [Candidatus Babeliales bacterium]